MRMPTKASTRLTLMSLLLVGASLMTACSGSGLTAPQASKSGSLAPKGRSQTGYVVAEKDSTIDNTIQQGMTSLTQTLDGTDAGAVLTFGKKLAQP